VSSKGASFALIPLHFTISPCPVKDLGHAQLGGRWRSYSLSLRADLVPYLVTGHGERILNWNRAPKSAKFMQVAHLNSSPQPPSLEKRRGRNRFLPLSFQERGPGGEFKRCQFRSNSPPFCDLPVSSKRSGTRSAQRERA
jgi:hypothetical protein